MKNEVKKLTPGMMSSIREGSGASQIASMMAQRDYGLACHDHNLQKALEEWLTEMMEGKQVVFYTLTFGYDSVSKRQVNRHFMKFRNEINQLVLKSAYRKHNRKLKNVAFIESRGERPHIHGVCEVRADRLSQREMSAMIRNCWKHGIVDVQEVYDMPRLANYVTKLNSKNSISESILF